MNNLVMCKQFPSLERFQVYITKLILFIYAAFFIKRKRSKDKERYDVGTATKTSRGKVFDFSMCFTKLKLIISDFYNIGHLLSYEPLRDLS